MARARSTGWGRFLRRLGGMALALAAGTLLVDLLERGAGVPNAAPAFLLLVVAVAVAFDTVQAILAAVAAFLLYDYFFVAPIYTFTVSDPGEWLNLVLLLVVGVVVGQLAGRQRSRAEAAEIREREARALFHVSRALATAGTLDALQAIVGILCAEGRMDRAWIGLAGSAPRERVVADTATASGPPPQLSTHGVLRRTPGDTPAEWVRVHIPSSEAPSADRRAKGSDLEAYRVLVEAGDRRLGSVWALRARSRAAPDRAETRVLAAAADQIAGALERDRLAAEATSAEVARQSEALKSALLDSVSHDLRTPLASIRAAAGSLMDPGVAYNVAEQHEIAASIDREADRLNRLVTNLLDMSRIEAGGLRPSLEPFVVADLVGDALERLRRQLGPRVIRVAIPDELPAVVVDEVFFDQVVTNILENAAKYTPPDALIAIGAVVEDEGRTVRLTVEDGGPGVPDDSLQRLFEKFYRVPRSGEGSRRGTGVGLAVVRGLVEAMGGRIEAERSALGGLALTLHLPAATGFDVGPTGSGPGVDDGR